MAIIQISKIQHRRGLSQDLPQLASAELGWSIDTRQLYIGNGTIEEGAPTLGNTEILTEYSDILSVAQTYTYKGESGGYAVQTGASTSAPIARTLQSKLDDIVNVRDFGVTGDGVTNDLPAINRALFELFCRAPNNTLSRRTLYFPGGTYKISGGVVKIPTSASIIGDGPNKTIILQADAAQSCVVKTADSLQQIDSNVGSNGATLPQFIGITGMTLANQSDNDVLRIRTTNALLCRDVVFVGGRGSPVSSSGNKTSVKIEAITSPAIIPSYNILFDHCGFVNSTYALYVNDSNIYDVNFNNCYFTNLYQGIKLGELTVVDPRPTAIKVSGSLFDAIYDSAINCYTGTTGILSTANHFRNVGNQFNGAGNPAAAVIVFQSDNCYSIGDIFDRPESDVVLFPLIDKGTGTGGPKGLSQGRQTIGSGSTVTLVDNTGSSTTIESFTVTNAIIEYTITRSGTVRTGIIKLTASGYDDEYQETASTGVTLSVTTATGVQSLEYTTTSTGADATLTYAVKYFS